METSSSNCGMNRGNLLNGNSSVQGNQILLITCPGFYQSSLALEKIRASNLAWKKRRADAKLVKPR
jgi:hypothetical protein